jgi:hypothetical protein
MRDPGRLVYKKRNSGEYGDVVVFFRMRPSVAHYRPNAFPQQYVTLEVNLVSRCFSLGASTHDQVGNDDCINSEPRQNEVFSANVEGAWRPRVHAKRGIRGRGPSQVEAIRQQRIVVGAARPEDGSLFGLDGGERRIKGSKRPDEGLGLAAPYFRRFPSYR